MNARRKSAFLWVALPLAICVLWGLTIEPRPSHILGLYSLPCLLINVAVTYFAVGSVYVLNKPAGRRRRTFAFCAVTLSGTTALGLIEIAMMLQFVDYRIVFDTPVNKAWENPRNVMDPELLHIHRPYDEYSGSIPGDLVGWLGIETSRRYDVAVRYDGNGFRNAEDLKKADIVLIGDSFVEGSIVSYDSIASTRLSRMRNTTVLNLGQTGYGPQQCAEALRRFGFTVQPRTVVWVVFEGNDLTHDFRRYESLGGVPENFIAEYHSMWNRSFLRNSLMRLDRIFYNPQPQREDGGRNRSGLLAIPEPWDGQRVYFGFDSKPLTERDVGCVVGAQRIMRGVADECRNRGINFMIAFAPIKFRVIHDMVRFAPDSQANTWTVNDLEDRMASWAQSEGISYVDLTPALRLSASEGSLGYFLDDGHWNAKGHEVAANQIASFLKGIEDQ